MSERKQIPRAPATKAPAAPTTPPPARPEQPTPRGRVALPTAKTPPVGDLAAKTIFVYGPPKIGKSTLVAEFPDVLFLDTEGGLSELEVYRVPIGSWTDLIDVCDQVTRSPRFRAVCVDTIDMAALICAAHTNSRLGIIHESDADWGKGWAVARNEMLRQLVKITSHPRLGLILVSHAREVEIRTRGEVYSRWVPSLTPYLRDLCLALSDLVLFVDFEATDARVIRTKPSRYWEAGERGRTPRLPPTLPLSYDALDDAWNRRRGTGGAG